MAELSLPRFAILTAVQLQPMVRKTIAAVNFCCVHTRGALTIYVATPQVKRILVYTFLPGLPVASH